MILSGISIFFRMFRFFAIFFNKKNNKFITIDDVKGIHLLHVNWLKIVEIIGNEGFGTATKESQELFGVKYLE